MYPQFSAVDVDDQGNLWLRRPTATGLEFDVWNRDGHQLAVVPAGDVTRQYMVRIRDGHLYAVQFDEDEVPYVVRYRIVR